MGYSCTAEADRQLRSIMDQYFNGTNFKRSGDLMRSFEVGKEQRDGSIIGSVELSEYAGKNDQGLECFTALKVASFTISADGEVIFPVWALVEVKP